MEKVAITLNVPADIARQAEQAGLLTDDALTTWLQRELDRRTRANAFFEIIDQLADLEPELSPEEIATELEAYRTSSK